MEKTVAETQPEKQEKQGTFCLTSSLHTAISIQYSCHRRIRTKRFHVLILVLTTLSCLFIEVTKVRRNLFNQEIVSPSKKAKVPRSQSVSAVEGLKRKRCDDSEGKRIVFATQLKECNYFFTQPSQSDIHY